MKKLRLGGIFAAFALSVASIATMCSENEPKKPQLPSWGIIFTPSTIGQVALHNYRGNMVTYLQENEKAAQEGIKRFWGLSDGMWQKVRTKIDADKEANKKALYQPGNNFNTVHHPEITSHPIYNMLKEECAREGTNPHSFHIGINEIPGLLAYTQVHPMQTQGSISGMNMHIPSFLRNRAPLFLKQHVMRHEHWHLVEQHGLEKNVFGYVKAVVDEDSSQLINESLLGEKEAAVFVKKIQYESRKMFLFRDFTAIKEEQLVLQEKLEDFKNKAEEFHKNCATIADRAPKYANSVELQKLIDAQEKTADTILSCTDANASRNSALSYATNLAGYTDNKEDVLKVCASWAMTGAIKTKDNATRSLEQKRQQYLVKPAGQCTIL